MTGADPPRWTRLPLSTQSHRAVVPPGVQRALASAQQLLEPKEQRLKRQLF